MTNRPYIVLGWLTGKKIPRPWEPRAIGQTLTEFTRSMGLVPLRAVPHTLDHACSWYDLSLQAGVRRRTAEHGQGEDWHQDGDTTPGARMNQAIVLWASNTPTLFRDMSGQIWQPSPWEVVLFKNLECYHKRPSDTPRKRWTFRQRVEIPEFLV